MTENAKTRARCVMLASYDAQLAFEVEGLVRWRALGLWHTPEASAEADHTIAEHVKSLIDDRNEALAAFEQELL